MITETQIPKKYLDVINNQIDIFHSKRSVQEVNTIPDQTRIPLENATHWLKIPNVICVFVDMKGSTQLSASTKDNNTAGAYQLYTGTAVQIFNSFDAPYIDVRGDGAFALFNEDQPYLSFAAAVTFKTFANIEFSPLIKELTGLEIGSHIGIDQKTVLVKKIGLKHVEGRTDRQNEVWAGKPVNMASKLASLTEDNQLLVSDRFFTKIQNDLVIKSCGCGNPNNEKTNLWTEIDVTENKLFDFNKAYLLKSQWCRIHGKEYCDSIINLD